MERKEHKSSFRFEDRTLSALASTQVQMDPDLVMAHDLRRWYLEEGMNVDMTDLTLQTNNQENGSVERSAKLWISSSLVSTKTFAQVAAYEQNMPSAGPGEIFRIKAVCTFIRRDPVYKVRENDHPESIPLCVVRF